MDQQHVENETETSDDLNNKEKTSIIVSTNETAAVQTELAAHDHEEEEQEQEEKALDGVSNFSANEQGDVKVNEVSERPASRQEKINSSTPSLEDPDGDPTAPPDRENISHEGDGQLLQQLLEERDVAVRRSHQLQAILSEYFRKKKARDDDTQPEKEEAQEAEQLREYEESMSVLSVLRRELATESGAAQKEAEELRILAQEKQDKVEKEWRAFMDVKRDAAVTVLSRSLGKQAAQHKVESILEEERLQQDRLTALRIEHNLLRARVRRLEADIRDEEERGRDPVQIQFEVLMAKRLEQKKVSERQREEASKLQTKISSGLELLVNVKEKLYWSQREVQVNREQLAEVEATVARRREVLTRTKQARNSLQRDNQRLKESCGLLGNKLLLRDFENTVDAVDQLEEQLERLKSQHAKLVKHQIHIIHHV